MDFFQLAHMGPLGTLLVHLRLEMDIPLFFLNPHLLVPNKCFP